MLGVMPLIQHDSIRQDGTNVGRPKAAGRGMSSTRGLMPRSNFRQTICSSLPFTKSSTLTIAPAANHVFRHQAPPPRYYTPPCPTLTLSPTTSGKNLDMVKIACHNARKHALVAQLVERGTSTCLATRCNNRFQASCSIQCNAEVYGSNPYGSTAAWKPQH